MGLIQTSREGAHQPAWVHGAHLGWQEWGCWAGTSPACSLSEMFPAPACKAWGMCLGCQCPVPGAALSPTRANGSTEVSRSQGTWLLPWSLHCSWLQTRSCLCVCVSPWRRLLQQQVLASQSPIQKESQARPRMCVLGGDRVAPGKSMKGDHQARQARMEESRACWVPRGLLLPQLRGVDGLNPGRELRGGGVLSAGEGLGVPRLRAGLSNPVA